MRPIIQNDVSLERFNTFGFAARARHFVEVETVEALEELTRSPVWRDGKRLVLGGGSNVVFTTDFDGLVVRIATRGIRHLGIEDRANVVAVEAGESWDATVRTLVGRGWPGLENLVAIPGSVGAAPVQNIGAYGLELAERFAWLDAFDSRTGATTRMDAAACAFGYRDSVFKRSMADGPIIVRVAFRLPVAWVARRGYADVETRLAAASIDEPSPAQMMALIAAIRREKLPDPAVTGNAGSFFKNVLVTAATFDRLRAAEPGVIGHPEADGRVKLAAGWLIDRCGWRGRSLPASDGRAAVHERQALVLVNRGGATGADVLALASAIRDSVRDRFGIDLEPEPMIVR